MPAQYADLGGRRFVNEDFVDEVRGLYPASTRKIPLGYSTYTGWTGKDEVLFTEHDAVEDLDGKVYEVTVDPANPAAFDEQILANVSHTTKKATVGLGHWGPTLAELAELAASRREARVSSGLYGYAKSVQASCEVAVGRLNRRARALVKRAVDRDPAVVGFLQVHARRGPSSSARALLGAYTSALPRLAAEEKEAAATRLGMYGYPAKTARLGLSTCLALREEAGILAADLHARRVAVYEKITGFLGEHAKTAGCVASDLILSCYPEAGFKFRRASEMGGHVGDWIAWDPRHTGLEP